MKPSDLIKVLKKIVREEVKRTVTEEVNKSMAKLLAEIINNKKGDVINDARPRKEEVSVDKQVKYSINPKLNEVLNRTVSDLRHNDRESGLSSPRVSLSDMFDKIGDGGINDELPSNKIPLDGSSKINMLKSMVGESTGPAQNSILDVASETPLANTFKKDFRSMMKKIDSIKSKGGSGMFTGAIPMNPQLGGYEQV